MTKIIKWWKRVSFWNKIKLFLLPLSIGQVVTSYLMDADKIYYFIPVGVYIITHAIEVFVKDEDGDGKVDPL